MTVLLLHLVQTSLVVLDRTDLVRAGARPL
jgi:hypothetical protein